MAISIKYKKKIDEDATSDSTAAVSAEDAQKDAQLQDLNTQIVGKLEQKRAVQTEFENKMRVLTDVPSENAFRGFSCKILVVDECAWIASTKYQLFKDSVFPSQSSFAWKKNIILSTPNGINHFNVV